MAKKDSAPAALIVDKEREILALTATCEIDELATLLSKELSDRAEIGNLALIGITKRIMGLNNVVMSAIGDKSETTDSLTKRLG